MSPLLFIIVALAVAGGGLPIQAEELATSRSPGHTTYYVNPAHGSDSAVGTSERDSWRSFARLNATHLAAGDHVVVDPGDHFDSLAPQGSGTADEPIEIRFRSGSHRFHAQTAHRLAAYVSNSADDPETPRPIGIVLRNVSHLKLVGEPDTKLSFVGRMTQIFSEHSEDIAWRRLSFDMERPTVSELFVEEGDANHAVVRIADGSTYTIENGRFAWTGDLGPGWTMVQVADPKTGECHRVGRMDPFSNAAAKRLADGRIRLSFAEAKCPLLPGKQYQFRNVTRDTVSGANLRCKNLTFADCKFYSLPGMGIVSQFCENVSFRCVDVAPPAGSNRACAAWADCFHFSGCRGRVEIINCKFSGTQDDPVNVHGTFLRIVSKPSPSAVIVKFMHPQTYGFAAFQAGDRVEQVSHENLRCYAANTVARVEQVSATEWKVTLQGPAADFADGDVLENITWYPEVTIRNCQITMCSTRGILVTTRAKVVIEGNAFLNCAMSGIDIADDANSWFESGGVRDVTIRSNTFVHCGEPAVFIHPEVAVSTGSEPVHENIRIKGNSFQNGAGISAKSVRGLTISGNSFSNATLPIHTAGCEQVVIEKNRLAGGQ